MADQLFRFRKFDIQVGGDITDGIAAEWIC
jgi:hypothetical protein